MRYIQMCTFEEIIISRCALLRTYVYILCNLEDIFTLIYAVLRPYLDQDFNFLSQIYTRMCTF